jgi:molybdopterin/thiamine biosynthesis adenylyltransferase
MDEPVEDINRRSQETEENPPEVLMITDPATDRYNTFTYISWWRQEIVRGATVMVIGAGALGNEVLKNLALMGIGRIFIADFDTIEDSNLSRSVLFRASDNRGRKAEVAATAVRELNPEVAVSWFHGDINHELGLGVYRRMGVVIGCLDNREARLSINKACWHLGKPWINGGILGLDGEISVFWPNRGACYDCTLSDEDYRIISIRLSCSKLAKQSFIQGKIPTTPTSASIISALQTQEALKILHNIEVKSGTTTYVIGLTNDFIKVERKEKTDCLSHDMYSEITEVPTATAERTSIGELLSRAREDLGDSAYLVIPDFVVRGECLGCGEKKEIMRPRFRLFNEDEKCPHCSEVMKMISHDTIKGGEEILEMSLAQIGIPALDIVPARNEKWDCRYYELTGDADSLLKFSVGNREEVNDFYERRKPSEQV